MNKIEYQVWFNHTLTARRFRVKGAPPFVISAYESLNDEVVSLTRGIDEAIYLTQAGIGDDTPIFDVKLKDFPETPGSKFTRCPTNPDTIFEALGPVFLFGPAMIIFLVVINTVVAEKENRLKDAVEMVGLLPSVFWISHFLNYFVVCLIHAIIISALGKAFGFGFFVNTDYSVLFSIFFLLALASVSFGLFISSLTRNVKIGIGIAVFFVILGFIYCVMGGFVAYLWYQVSGGTDFRPGWPVLMFLPFFNYTKIIQDIFTITNRKVAFDKGDCYITNGDSFTYSMLNDYIRSDGSAFAPTDVTVVPVPGQSLGFLTMNVFFWFFLALYFDQIFPNENGYSLHPLYFLFPSFWGFEDPEFMKPKQTQSGLPASAAPLPNEDSAVTSERQLATDMSQGDYGLRIVGLNKRYDMGLNLIISWVYKIFGLDDYFLSEKPDVKCAINELSLVVNKGDLLALLGSNGAGKTSTMKILYGASTPTRGDAFVFGLSIRTHMNEIRKMLGVCPQFDLLFADLSAKEHVELFCGIKGVPQLEAQSVAEKRLKHMKLWDVRDQRAGSYSGGMKRRLSVVLSTLGDPKCVFLDEPTTGME
jgi:ABC-type lipoprotein export system ATPase subunit